MSLVENHNSTILLRLQLWRKESKMKSVGIWLVLVAMLCSPTIANAQSPENGEVNVTGKWQGTRRTTGLGRGIDEVRSIKFDLTQSGETISGSYECYAGKKATADCANPVGRITTGTINSSKIKIDVQALPNNYTCSFKGSVASANMKGTYSCYVGGSLSSIGVWKVHRR